jgi:hypothetical protein
MSSTSFNGASPEKKTPITLETITLTSVDPQILSTFFSKEADALSEHIKEASLDPRLTDLYRTVLEQTRKPRQSMVTLQSRAEEFNMRREKIIDAKNNVPELAQLATDRVAEEIYREWRSEVNAFLQMKTALFGRIQLYGLKSADDAETNPRALNTQFADFGDSDRDMILQKTFGDSPHLAFWDVTFSLKLLHHEHTQALAVANLLEDYRARLAIAPAEEHTPLRVANGKLSSILADLPALQVPEHLVDSFKKKVEHYFSQRVARACTPNRPR